MSENITGESTQRLEIESLKTEINELRRTIQFVVERATSALDERGVAPITLPARAFECALKDILRMIEHKNR